MLILVFKVEMPPCTCYRMGGPLQWGLHHRKWGECRPLTLHPSWDMEEDTFNDQKPFLKKGKIEWRHRDGGRKTPKCHICPECLSPNFPDLFFHTSCQEISLTDANEYALSTTGGRRRRCSRNVSSNLPVSRYDATSSWTDGMKQSVPSPSVLPGCRS